jgi:hypothetical protein
LDQNTKKGIKKRERKYKLNENVEEEAPLNTPDWAKLGYNGPLKSLTSKAVSKYITK